MRVWEIADAFGLDHLRMTERPAPTPGMGEVVVRVRCTSLNYRDLMMVRGEYNPRQRLPLVPLSDAVGDVISTGPGVTRVSVGDRVATVFAQRWMFGSPDAAALRSSLGGPIDGVLAEQVVLSADGVVRVPAHLSDAEAATLPCAALTAWSALVRHARVSPGDTVLVQGTGGVSIFALQFARLLGARVIATSSTRDKLERLRELGASEVLSYREEPAWGKRVLDLTGGRGVDCVVEVGGAGTFEQSVRAVRPGGTIALIGVLAGGAGSINLVPVLMRDIRVQGVFAGPRSSFEAMNRAIETAQMRPVVDRVFELEQARDAFAYLASGAHVGKVCIRVAHDVETSHVEPTEIP